MKASECTVLPFPCMSSSAQRRALRKELLNASRTSASPVVVDMSGCNTLNHDDVDCLLECIAEVAGRDTLVLLVAGSPANRVLLEVTRIGSLVPVFNSMQEALADPQVGDSITLKVPQTNPSPQVGSA